MNLLNIFITKTGQSLKEARIETVKFLDSHKMNCDKIRSIDETIGYLIKNNIKINYQLDNQDIVKRKTKFKKIV